MVVLIAIAALALAAVLVFALRPEADSGTVAGAESGSNGSGDAADEAGGEVDPRLEFDPPLAFETDSSGYGFDSDSVISGHELVSMETPDHRNHIELVTVDLLSGEETARYEFESEDDQFNWEFFPDPFAPFAAVCGPREEAGQGTDRSDYHYEVIVAEPETEQPVRIEFDSEAVPEGEAVAAVREAVADGSAECEVRAGGENHLVLTVHGRDLALDTTAGTMAHIDDAGEPLAVVGSDAVYDSTTETEEGVQVPAISAYALDTGVESWEFVPAGTWPETYEGQRAITGVEFFDEGSTMLFHTGGASSLLDLETGSPRFEAEGHIDVLNSCRYDGTDFMACTVRQPKEGAIPPYWNVEDDFEPVAVQGFRVSGGEPLWEIRADDPDRVMPELDTAYNGMIYASANDSYLVIDASTGEDVAFDLPASADYVAPGLMASIDSESSSIDVYFATG